MPTPSFHYRPNGSCPYEEYVRKVFFSGRKTDAAKIRAYADRLGELGSQRLVELKWAEKMNDVWQLRPAPHRIFYFWDSRGRKYVLLNGYEKKTKRTPPKELKRAEALREEHHAPGG